jgi:hypothetical protein
MNTTGISHKTRYILLAPIFSSSKCYSKCYMEGQDENAKPITRDSLKKVIHK